ncbi:MAG: MGMT family protein [Firmicutes bacterium]|nr:MGMT family protein [Bacillota bacterium]
MYAVTLPQKDRTKTVEELLLHPVLSRAVQRSYPSLENDLLNYWRGEQVTFAHYPLDFSDYSLFCQRVLTLVRDIPYGETRSYKWVAEQIGQPKAARAVGQAVGHNRFLIVVPCHRVTAHRGMLGGFSSGLTWKRYLLALEGVCFSAEGIILNNYPQ